MTDYELFSLAAKFEEVALLNVGLYWTAVSGFLVMSYAIGAELTRRQTWFVVPIFTVFSLMGLYGAVAYSALADRFYPAAYRDPDKTPFSIINLDDPLNTENLFVIIGGLVILGSLMFLRDVRVRAAKEAKELSNATEKDTECHSPQQPISDTKNPNKIEQAVEVAKESLDATGEAADEKQQSSS